MDIFFIFILVVLGVALLTLWAGIKVVPQGQKWTVERFGRYTRTLEPGLSVIVPYVDTIGRKFNVMESVLDVPSQSVISKDNVAVRADGVVFYRIDDAAKAAYQISNLTHAIENLTTTNLRSVLGSMELDDMLSSREKINGKLLEAMDAATDPWGVKVTRVEVRELAMSEELQEAMNLQMTAERRRRALVTEANGRKEAEVLKAEGEKQAAVLRAEGEKQAAILNAEAREREAQAEAKATEVVSQALASGNQNAINYFLGTKYVEALSTIGSSSNSKLVLMPLEAGGITGAVAGITEMLKSTGAINR